MEGSTHVLYTEHVFNLRCAKAYVESKTGCSYLSKPSSCNARQTAASLDLLEKLLMWSEEEFTQNTGCIPNCTLKLYKLGTPAFKHYKKDNDTNHNVLIRLDLPLDQRSTS